MNDKIFKCPNHMKVTVKKDGGEVALDEDCCTSMIILLKNDGNMATSFYGYHNEKVIKIMAKAQKKYFRSLKKRLKYESIEDDITIKNEDIPEDKKWDNSKKTTSDKTSEKTSGENIVDDKLKEQTKVSTINKNTKMNNKIDTKKTTLNKNKKKK